MINLGTVRPGSTILIPFNAFDSNDPSASVIVSDFVLADIGIYKGTSMTERGSTTGVVLLDTDGINIDAATGIHGFSIDLSSNATAGFYSAGSHYYVTVGPITIDAATVNFVAATFMIGYPDAILNTTIGTRTSATVLVLAAGPADDDALNGCTVLVHDVASAVQIAIGYVLDYDGGSTTVTLGADPGVFASAATDNISFFMPANVQAWLGTPVAAATAGIPDVNVEEINNNIPAVHTLRDWMEEGIRLTADSGTTTTLVDAGLTQADDYWNGSLLVFRTGTNSGRTAIVTDFDAASDTITFTPAVPDAVTTEGFALIPGLGWAARDLANTTDGLGALKAEPNAALVALGLDHLISASVSDTDVADDSIIAQMVDAGSISDYTNYSKTEDSLRAISEKVSSIGSASGGGFNFAAVGADALEDTINDNEAAVDKSTSPATVGIPVTGHAFLAGHEVTIGGTANYNGSFVIDSVSTDEVVIVSSFSVETFSGTDTIVSSIKAESIEGVETTNTFSSTVSEDGVYHVIDDDGADNFTISYRFEVGGDRIATEAVFHGFLNGSNDNALIQAYDFVGSAWETRALLTGQNGSVNQTIVVPLLARNTGTSATDLGVVFLRITDDTPRGSSNPTLNVDSLLVEGVGVGQTAGYQNGQIWLDTNNGTAGTEAFVNGVADEPCLTIADLKALSTSVGISDFHIINGSSVTLAESTVNESYFGDNWTLALGGQDVDGAYFQGASVTGVGTSATGVHYEGCNVDTMSVQIGHFDFCAFSGTVTQTLAGDYEYHNCYSNVAGAGAPTFTKTAGQAITAEWRNWMDSITVSGLQSGDTITINGRLGTVTLNGADATVEIRGSYKSIVNNLTGSPTVNIDGAWKGSDIADTLEDTAEIGTAGAGLTNINLPNQTMDIIGDITGNLSGSVGSVTGAVGSVTGAVGSVTGSVGSVVGHTAQSGDTFALANGANGFVALKAETALIVDDTGTAGVVVAAASKTGYRLSATGVDDVLDETYEGTTTFRQFLRLAAGPLFGILSGAAGTTITIRNEADDADRIVATVDADGNRTSITLTKT